MSDRQVADAAAARAAERQSLMKKLGVELTLPCNESGEVLNRISALAKKQGITVSECKPGDTGGAKLVFDSKRDPDLATLQTTAYSTRYSLLRSEVVNAIMGSGIQDLLNEINAKSNLPMRPLIPVDRSKPTAAR